jgi:hypothetical protein
MFRNAVSSRRDISSSLNSTAGCRTMAETPIDLVEIAREVVKRGEASVVILAVSILEDWLTGTLKARMRPLSETVEARLFGGQAPLRSFAAKIDIAYALQIIDAQTQANMRALKDIRNDFAHATTILHIDSPELTRRFQKLSGWTKDCDLHKLFNDRVADCLVPLRKLLNINLLASALMAYVPPSIPDTST